MPCRLIRDELLESERVLALPVEARWLYVTILLSADDLGLFEATSFKLARRSDIRREAGEQLLGMLADADLVRLYEVNGKRYGFIPRFRQRIQIKFLKHPAPPEALMHDDEDALSKIKHLASKTTVGQQMDNGPATAAQPSEAKAKAKAKSLPTGKEERDDAARSTRLPADLAMPMEWRSFCAAERPDLDPDVTFARFCDYWVAVPGVKGRKTDWLRTWRNWVRNERSTPARAGGLSKGAQTMAALTRGLTLPKQRANFWDKPAEQVVEVVDERKRLL